MPRFMMIWAFLVAELSLALVKKDVKPPAPTLTHVVLQVNGEKRLLRPPEQLQLIRGDTMIIIQAQFSNGTQAKSLEFAGQARPLKQVISTTSLKSNTIYQLKANGGSALEVKVLAPELRYAILKINEKSAVLRSGELLHLKQSDQFKLERVVTNMTENDESVSFLIVPIESDLPFKNVKFYEVRFLRRQEVFARVPLEIEGS